ncbi:MAG: VWA domain-containing protein [Pirellulaceae bacterium]|nr:VWA domain-containing protein [Pirellulaceae bacterium]
MFPPPQNRYARRMAVSLVFVVAMGVLPIARAAESDLEKEFRSIQRGIQTQLRSKSREQRLAAVKKLEAYPVFEAARVLLLTGLVSGDEEVRRASYEALLKCKEDGAIGQLLAVSIDKDLRRGVVDEGTCGAMAVLLAAKNPELEKKAQRLLEQAANAPNTSGLLLLVTIADVQGMQPSEASVKALQQLSRLPLFARSFAFRRAVTQGLIKVRQVEAVTALVEMLPAAEGEIRSDIVRYLTAISGQQHGADAMRWADWWRTSRATFKFAEPAKAPAVVRANVAPQGAKSYYGLPLLADRILFIMDTSGSMRGPRSEAAKRELIHAIAELPDSTYFSVLVFNSRVAVWQEQLVEATSENKEAACRYVAGQELAANTASYDALEAALTFDAEAIYFLTDGAPYGGKVTQPAQIVTVISRLNRLRRITINSIGIGVGVKGNVFDTFLSALAESNYGEYIRVDE